MNLSPEMTKAMIWGLPAVSVLFTWWLPAAVQISFFVSGVMSLIQSSLFRSDRFRTYFKMTPLPARPNPNGNKPSPYRGDLKIAAPAQSTVLSQSQLNSRFQGAGELKKEKGIFGGMKSEITDTFSGVAAKTREKMAASNEKSRVKREVRDAQAYELRRQAEIKQEKEDQQRRRRTRK